MFAPWATKRMTLSDLAAGTTATVVELRGGRGLVNRLAVLGFTPGAQVTVVQNYGRGPLIVMVRDSRVALGRGEARTVLVDVTDHAGA